MDCHAIGLALALARFPMKSHFAVLSPVHHNVSIMSSRPGFHKSKHLSQIPSGNYLLGLKLSRSHCVLVGMEERPSSMMVSEDLREDDENVDDVSPEDMLAKPLSSSQLQNLLADSERAKLVKKLSEANLQNRFLKRQLLLKDNDLVNFKTQLAVVELEVQALVALAEEITNCVIPEGSRKINGRYIQSHLLSRLEAVQAKLKEHIKDVEAVQSKEVPLFWVGMAESVQVMGSFDRWSQGEHLSPEYTGSFTRFSTTLLLRPGRYEVKFLVDGQWRLSPDFPTIGEGLMENNLLIVE